MTNNTYNYNGMTAEQIASMIIDKEEAYLKTDIASLSFTEKCKLLLFNNSTYHPLFRLLDLSSLAEELGGEITRRAEAGDSFALYCMAMLKDLGERTDTRLGYLERAVRAGSLEARVHYASRFQNDGTSTTRDLLDEVLSIISLGDIVEDDEEPLYRCYSMLSECGQTPIERAHYTHMLDELSVKLTLKGEWRALTYLCVKDSGTSEEHAFWRRVARLVKEHFYIRGAIQFRDFFELSEQ